MPEPGGEVRVNPVTCATQGHLWGPQGRCVMCGDERPAASEPPSYTPTWVLLTLRCGPCNYRWQDWQPCNVPPATWLAHIRAICRCPKCGAKRKVFMESGYRA